MFFNNQSSLGPFLKQLSLKGIDDTLQQALYLFLIHDTYSGWDYVREISRIGFRREPTIEISLRLSSRLFGLQNCDYIRLNGKKSAKKSHERKKSERIFPAVQNLLPGRPGNSLFPAAREALFG